MIILLAASVLMVAICVWLLVHTIRFVIPQQVKQLEVLPALWEDPFQKFILKLFILSLAGWVLAILVGMAGSYGLAQVAANAFHFTVTGIRIAPMVFLLQTVLAFVVPVAATLFPLLNQIKADSLTSRG
jgi:hypothetical protein